MISVRLAASAGGGVRELLTALIMASLLPDARAAADHVVHAARAVRAPVTGGSIGG